MVSLHGLPVNTSVPHSTPKMRRIINHVRGTLERTLLDPAARDGVTEPFVKLRERCEAYGYRFEGLRDQSLADCAWLVFWDSWRVDVHGFWNHLVTALKARAMRESFADPFRRALHSPVRDRLVLFMFEPPWIYPRNSDRDLHRYFRVIFTWDPALVDGKKYHRIYLPNPSTYPRVQPVPFAERKLLMDISGYKFSGHGRELYSERRRLARFFEENHPSAFDLYGEGWNPGLRAYLWRRLRDPHVRREFYPSYRGTVRHKWEICPRYRFGVCYENVADEPGYVSQRIFDYLRCGCVPVYLGAPDIEDYVDHGAFVDRRRFRSNADLAAYLVGMGEREYEGYLEAGRRYLLGDRFKLFLSEHFVDTVVSVLQLDRSGLS